MNFSPIMKACARPSGEGCSANSRCKPKSEPSPRSLLNPGKSAGVDIMSISLIPASISTEIG